jgi:hypothetical protein
VFYSTDTFRNKDGDKVSSITINTSQGPLAIKVDADVDVYTLAPTLIWVAPWRLPGGGRYGAFISPTFANNKVASVLSIETLGGIDADLNQFGVGDLFVQPLWFGWSGKYWDFSLGYGFYAPVGKYNTHQVTFPSLGLTLTVPDSDNIGLGFWTHQFQTAFGWYPFGNPGTLAVLALTGEIHSKKQDIDITPGANIALNWGVSQYLPLKKDQSLLLELGATGYFLWQVTDDTGSEAYAADVHDRVYAAGAQVGLIYAPWNAFAEVKYLHEFAAIDRFEGQMVTATFGIKFH